MNFGSGRWLLAALPFLLAAAPPSGATQSDRSVADYTHQKWSDETNAPAPVRDIAQGKSGFLWLATGQGLFRFDGIMMEAIQARRDLVAHGSPSALLVRRNGELWTNFERSRRFAAYRDGRLRLLAMPPAPDRIAVMREAPDGSVWALTESLDAPLVHYSNGRWRQFDRRHGLPVDNPFSMVVTPSGDVWMSFSQAVLRLRAGSNRFETVRETPAALGRLSLAPDGTIWLSERRGSYPLTGPGGRGVPPPLRFPYATDGAQIRGHPMFDRAGNLWIATLYGGLQRVARPDPRGASTSREAERQVENFDRRDGLSSNVTARAFQDLEGNIWVGTEKGIDKFWPATIRGEASLSDPAAFGDLLLAARDGTIYIAQARAVYRVRPKGDPEPILLPAAEPASLCEAPDGSIWIGIGKKVLVWKDGRSRWIGQPIPTSHTLYDCAFDRHGDYWVTGARGGMFRYSKGSWEAMFAPGGGEFQPRSMVADSKGILTFQWNARTLAQVDFPTVKSFRNPYRMSEPLALVLYSANAGSLYVAGPVGLARLRDGRFEQVTLRQAPMFEEIHGMAEDNAGFSWFAGVRSVIRLRTTDVDRAFSDPRYVPPYREFGLSAGLRSRPHSHSRRSLVRGGDGRIWIASESGTLWFDPDNIMTNANAPRLAIRAIRSRGGLLRDPVDVTLAGSAGDVEIDFAVLSFANPRRAQVRYRLEGQDANWIDAETRRQAFYTNLSPGRYRFQVIGANEDGVWNRTGASVTFEIPPTIAQTTWFRAIAVAAFAALAALLLRLRARQIRRQVHARIDERHRERERIARDLHDTLLQGMQGLTLKFQSIADRMPAASPNRRLLEAALERADDLMIEGRDRVGALRRSEGSADLPTLIHDLAASPLIGLTIPVRIDIEGDARPVDRSIAHEIADIVREALFNIARHAAARSASITIAFFRREVVVTISDDGVGIDDEILADGRKDGHFGLVGMRERATRIGGILSIASHVGRGTEIAVKVPARLAYRGRRPGRCGWLGRLIGTEPDNGS